MPEPDRDQNQNEKVMSFWDHLEELRWRIIKATIAVLVGGIASLAFSDQLLAFLLLPANRVGEGVRMVNLTPLSMIMVRLYIALVVGLLVGLPVVVFQIWRFISPGLYKHERRAAPWVLLSTFTLFCLGALLAFSMMPVLLSVLVQAGYQGVLPVVIYILSIVGLVSPAVLQRSRRYALVLIVVVAAFLTPSPDPFSQVAMALPLYLLFELSIFVSRMVWRAKAQRRLAEVNEQDAPAET